MILTWNILRRGKRIIRRTKKRKKSLQPLIPTAQCDKLSLCLRNIFRKITLRVHSAKFGRYILRAIVTVVGKHRVGIIAEICVLLSSFGVNILDINQTVMQEFFTMSMLVDTTQATVEFGDLVENLSKKGEEMGMKIRVNREDLFNAMHKI